MKVILMNKNKEVLVAEYNEPLAVFTKIYEIKNLKFAPLIIEKALNKNKEDITTLTTWFKGRGIPDWRDDLDLLMLKLGVSTPNELLDKAFGLSLSDQYWIKPYNSQIKYKNINFFDNTFDSADFTNATFSNSNKFNTKISLISPNNTTDGRLKKTWTIQNGKRYLLKGGYKNEVMQPFNEVLASQICERLNIKHTHYDLEIISNKIVSKCECFINKDTELIPASQILNNQDNAYKEYIKILESHGIKNVKEKLEDMFILDYIMMNEDRHLNNFGIIRNVNTLKWLDLAPIFDNGQSLNILDYNEEEIILNGQGRFFYNIMDFDDILKKISNLKRYKLENLNGITEYFANLLHKYQNITKMTDRRIDKICLLLNSRINKLKNLQNK